jgi:hypothetical protein
VPCTTTRMGQLFAAFRLWDVGLAVAAVVAFVVALIMGVGVKSLAFLGAGIWWMLLGRYWRANARTAQRHREPRSQRLKRERKGLAPPRG